MLPFKIMVTPDGRHVRGALDSPSTIHDFAVLSGIVRDGCSPTANVIDPWDESADYFARGALAMGDPGPPRRPRGSPARHAAGLHPRRGLSVGAFYDAWDFMIAGEKSPRKALEDAIPALQANLDKPLRSGTTRAASAAGRIPPQGGPSPTAPAAQL